MSRVSYVMMHDGRRGRADRRRSARRSTACSRRSATRPASSAPRSSSSRSSATRSCTTSCSGIDPTPLGSAPFALATDAAVELTAAELGVRAHPGARVYVLPCIAGHVGADTAGVILAEEPHKAEAMTLVVDVGTNAEIVLGDKRRLLAASSPDRPGVRGRPDQRRAARRARAPSSASASTARRSSRGSGSSASTPGRTTPGFADAVAAAGTGVTGICGSGIIEVVAELYLAGVITADGVIDGALAARTPRVVADGRTFSYVLHEPADDGPRILVTQNDVRAIQLAKAALYAGVRLLMDQLEIETVDEVRLAGAFGSQIDPLHAMVLGLVPDCDLVARPGGRQRRRHRRADRPAVGRRAARDRGGRPPGREDRDRGRAALPGALRRGDGDPAPDGRRTRTSSGSSTLPARPVTADRGGDARAERRRRRTAAAAADDAAPATPAATGTGDDR